MIELPLNFSCYLYEVYPNLLREGRVKLRARDLDAAISMLKLDPSAFSPTAAVALLAWRDRQGLHQDALLLGDGSFRYGNIRVRRGIN